MERYTTGVGQKILVHNRSECKGEYCCIHNPSNHHMKDWPTLWRDDRKLMERICPCGIGHPDPDDLAFKKRIGLDAETKGIHGCNGFCNPEIYLKYLKELELTNRKKIKWAVKEIRNCLTCVICGKKPIEWHSESHIGNDHRRISSLVQRNLYSTILEEINKCVPLCRSCHMKEDGRLDNLKRNQPYKKGMTYVNKKSCICCGKLHRQLRNGMCSTCDNHHSGRRLRKTISCVGCFDKEKMWINSKIKE